MEGKLNTKSLHVLITGCRVLEFICNLELVFRDLIHPRTRARATQDKGEVFRDKFEDDSIAANSYS